jgi:hypothetical protein
VVYIFLFNMTYFFNFRHFVMVQVVAMLFLPDRENACGYFQGEYADVCRKNPCIRLKTFIFFCISKVCMSSIRLIGHEQQLYQSNRRDRTVFKPKRRSSSQYLHIFSFFVHKYDDCSLLPTFLYSLATLLFHWNFATALILQILFQVLTTYDKIASLNFLDRYHATC